MNANNELLSSTARNNRLLNMNTNSVKETTKKNQKSPAAKTGAELSSPASPPLKNAPINSKIDANKSLAPGPIAPVSTPTPLAVKVSTIPAKVTAAGTPAPSPVARLATAPAPAPKAVAIEAGQTLAPKPAVSAPKTTTIEVKVDVGFGNTVYLRGKGPGLSWERGVACVCVDRNTWRWTSPAAEKLTFKLLLNDSVWAQGSDLVAGPGEKVQVVPAF